MSETFKFGRAKKEYEVAYKKNKGQHETYHCATATKNTPRSLDLNSKSVFCKNERNSGTKNYCEYLLQAYMAKKALLDESSWFLPIEGKKWALLDAERNFAAADLAPFILKLGHRRLDLLAYEAETQTFVILELKVPGSDSGNLLNTAGQELEAYARAIRTHISDANKFYSVEEDGFIINAKNVHGYIVWPANDNPRKLDSPWGLIEYDKYFLDKNKVESIKFDIIKEPD